MHKFKDKHMKHERKENHGGWHHGNRERDDHHEQNPGSDSGERTGNGKAMVDTNKCIGCGKCVRICPESAIRL